MRQSVGQGGENARADVELVQQALNKIVGKLGIPPLKVDKSIGPNTIDAIMRYQRAMGMPQPTGRIEPGGKIAQSLGFAAIAGAASAASHASDLSGSAWWHANQAKWPNESSVTALSEPFRSHANKFLAALAKAGASVRINATTRSLTRATIMRYCWDIAKGQMSHKNVPAISGVTINWDHGDATKSRKAASDMVALFAIKKQPSLNSNHLRGTAVDMTIGWTGELTIEKADGKSVTIKSLPRDGMNAALHQVGETYGVKHKLPDDPPHWSNTGR